MPLPQPVSPGVNIGVQAQPARANPQLSQIYQSQLGRDIGQEGLDYWTQQQRQGMSLEDISRAVSQSPEARQAVAGMYQPILGREADPAGLDYFARDLQAGQSLSDVERSILAHKQQQDQAALDQTARADAMAMAEADAARTGLTGAESEYQRALGRTGTGLEQATGTLQPWAAGGQAAFEQQQALSGAMGPEAQQAAISAFQESPEQAWLREQAQREVERYASATGQTQGGNVLEELQRRAIGLASQDYGNKFARLGQVAGVGGQAASQLGQAQLGAGQFDANLMANLGQLRYGVGQDMSQNIGQTVSALSGLQQQQGLGQADIYGQGATNIGNILGRTGQQFAQIPMDVSTLLANLAVQQGTQTAPYVAGAGAATAQGQQAANQAYTQSLAAAADAYANR